MITTDRKKLIRMMTLANNHILDEIDPASYTQDEQKLLTIIKELSKMVLELTEDVVNDGTTEGFNGKIIVNDSRLNDKESKEAINLIKQL